MGALIFVDVEATGASVSVGTMTEFAAVEFKTGQSFHGHDDSSATMVEFDKWLAGFTNPTFVSDNIAFDWQWINDAFHKHLGRNPFGHSGRRISDFFAGLERNFRHTQSWKKHRITPHDHNPLNDARGNVEAFRWILQHHNVQAP